MKYIMLDLEWNQAYAQKAIAVQKRLSARLRGEGLAPMAGERRRVLTPLHPSSDAPSSLARCLQNYIPAQSLTLSCPVCRQTSILPEQGVSALQNNFFISSLMEAMQQAPDGAHDPEDPHPLSAVAGRPLSCPNHEGKVGPSRPSEARTWGGGAGEVGGGG